MLKNLSKRETILLVVLALALVLYGYYSFLLLPILNGMETSTTNIVKYNQEINSQALSKVLLQKDKQKLEELRTNMNSAYSNLPQQERDADIAYNIKELGEASGISLTSVNFSEPMEYKLEQAPKVSGTLMSIPVNIQISGEYQNIMSFISKLEKGNRISVVNTVTLSGAEGKVSGNLSVNYLYIPSQANADIKYDFNTGTYGKDDLFK
jgi:type IV pilus assembly protein PilO